MEEGVIYGKYDKNEKNVKGKDAECHDDTSPVDMEEGVKYINDDKSEIYIEEKEV